MIAIILSHSLLSLIVSASRLAALEQKSISKGPDAAKRGANTTSAPTAHIPAAEVRPLRPQPPSPQQQVKQPKLPPTPTTTTTFIYAPLPDAIASGPAAAPLGLNNNNSSLAQTIDELLKTNPHRTTNTDGIVDGKLKDKTLLLDNPPVTRHQGRRSGQGQILTRSLATRKEQRRQGLYDVHKSAPSLTYVFFSLFMHIRYRCPLTFLSPPTPLYSIPQQYRFQSALALHQRWKEYIHALLHPATSQKEVYQLLINADYHGCFLRVSSVHTKDQRWQGLRGIVVRNTLHTFMIITPDDRLVVVPKKPCVFECAVGSNGARVVTMLGRGLCHRSPKPSS